MSGHSRACSRWRARAFRSVVLLASLSAVRLSAMSLGAVGCATSAEPEGGPHLAEELDSGKEVGRDAGSSGGEDNDGRGGTPDTAPGDSMNGGSGGEGNGGSGGATKGGSAGASLGGSSSEQGTGGTASAGGIADSGAPDLGFGGFAGGGPENPAREGGRFAAMVSPTNGESFIAPATLRLVGIGHDPNVYTNEPVDGKGTNAARVEFMVDGTPVLEVSGADAEYHVFKGFVEGIPAGAHRVWLRASFVEPDLVLDSEPMLVEVAEAPTYAEVVELDADIEIGAGENYVLEGFPDTRIRLNGNGHRIVAVDAGNVVFRNVDVFDLGNPADTSEPAMSVTVSGDLTIENSSFDTSNTLAFTLDGAATASVRANLFRSNMRMPIGQFPDEFGESGGASFPVLRFAGNSSGAKTFAGNNVGAGWVIFDGVDDWNVGGDAEADSNVLIGPRVGIHVVDSSTVDVRGNFSHHVYYGGWSQGNNLELMGSPAILVEHNVVYGSSWPVRGAGCEFRYNLVLEAGHQWLWVEPDAAIHHNVFVGGDSDVGGIYVLYEPESVRIYNNTFDGLLGERVTTAVLIENGSVTLSSNTFVGIPRSPAVTINDGSLNANYNAFLDTDVQNYSDNRTPANDLSATDASFQDPPNEIVDFDESALWRRTESVASVLARYRERYTPTNGSPLIDSGDPSYGDGNDIGAIGSGTEHPDDRFGRP